MAASCHLHLFLLFLLHLLFSTSAQSSSNIAMREPRSRSDSTPYWTSPSGEFAFGFHPKFDLVAIWFDKIPQKTIIWTANQGNPVGGGASVQILLTSNGVLALEEEGRVVWSVGAPNSGEVSNAAILNTGELVIYSKEGIPLWSSFYIPTDTIMPTQILKNASLLSSRQTDLNYTKGRFQLTVQADGNIVLNTMARPTDDKYTAYWASHTWQVGTELVFNQSGTIYQNLRNATSRFYLSRNSTESTALYYQRVTLDFDGVLRKYIYPRNGSSPKAWTTSWSIPEDICAAQFDKIGSGVCGFNSYCRLDTNKRPACDCPPSYVYADPNNTFGGCEPKFAPQACSGAGDGFRMENLPNTDWPSNEYEYIKSQNEDWCRSTCLDDCLCFAAVIVNRTECLFKKYPLSSGRLNPNFNGTTLIKVGTHLNGATLIDVRPKSIDSIPKRWIVAGIIVLNIAIVFLLMGFYLSCCRKQTQKTPNVVHASGVNLRSFSFKELEDATDGFKEELGSGAFSVVYKGVLKSDSGRLVAVKRLDRIVHGNDKEFKVEMSAIGKTNHKNLACLLGFCDEGAHRILVYEYMRNGSLAKSLFKGSSLGWGKRVQIATGIARGLAYLHEDCSSQIIHCDVKPQNILLDDSYVARISDFGLAKLLQCEQSRTSTGIRGTRGYVAPEWFKNMPVTAKVDVYSFGIMLLEIVCCRRNAELKPGAEDMEILSEIAYGCCEQRAIHQLVANDKEAQYDVKTVETLVMVALWCIQDEPSLRPSMKKVTQMLEGVAEVSMPKDPYSFTSSTGFNMFNSNAQMSV